MSEQPKQFRIDGENHIYQNGGRLIERDDSFSYLGYLNGEQGAEGYRKFRESDMLVDTDYILGESPSLSQEVIDEVTRLEQVRRELKGLE